MYYIYMTLKRSKHVEVLVDYTKKCTFILARLLVLSIALFINP